ncbi:hypothetical protein DPMN_076023 [Dreissena polymorpha]|uniref:Ig-like domain-containing protein n=1 Tax=Dreissena polymorpha TaxID=45954 RepID=A0A9D4BFE6_DREPO|nr:hypothetical protein DPMN_076023 [Dreissena polymorpha]
MLIVAAQTTSATLSVPSGTEGSTLTLTCQYSAEDAFIFGWLIGSTSTASQTYVGQVYNSYNGSSCVPALTVNLTLYSYSCSNTSRHTMTVRNLTSSNHGEIWQCNVFPLSGGVIYSKNVTISVQG